MNTLELKNKTKETIDEFFNEVEEFKVKAEQIHKSLKNEWKEEVENLENHTNSLKDIHNKISQASEDSAKELAEAFDEQKASAQKRVDHLREIYSKTLN